jgi:dihydroorotate dehydrogenase (fumarate)
VGVKDAVSIPVAVKLAPYFSSFGEMAAQLDRHGADGLVLFNRFFQPDVDVESLQLEPNVDLSTTSSGRLPRTWISALYGRVRASLAGTSGVETSDDVVKYLLAGADVVMTTSSLLRYGPQHAAKLVGGLEQWMLRKGFNSIDDFRGLLAVPNDVDGAAYERQGYVAALTKARSSYEDYAVSKV